MCELSISRNILTVLTVNNNNTEDGNYNDSLKLNLRECARSKNSEENCSAKQLSTMAGAASKRYRTDLSIL